MRSPYDCAQAHVKINKKNKFIAKKKIKNLGLKLFMFTPLLRSSFYPEHIIPYLQTVSIPIIVGTLLVTLFAYLAHFSYKRCSAVLTVHAVLTVKIMLDFIQKCSIILTEQTKREET